MFGCSLIFRVNHSIPSWFSAGVRMTGGCRPTYLFLVKEENLIYPSGVLGIFRQRYPFYRIWMGRKKL